MEKKRRKWLLTILFLLVTFQGYAQFESFSEFGKNRIQSRRYKWKYLSTKHVKLYYYEEGFSIARQYLYMADSMYQHVGVFLGNKAKSEKAEIYIYNNVYDLNQSNVGIHQSLDSYGNSITAHRDVMEIAYEGDRKAFGKLLNRYIVRNQVRQGILYEAQGMVSVPPSQKLPEWLIEGVVLFLSEGMSLSAKIDIAEYISRADTVEVEKIERDRQYEIGRAVWNYIYETYGEKVFKNVLQVNKLKNPKESFYAVIGKEMTSFWSEWKLYYESYNSRLSYLPSGDSLIVSYGSNRQVVAQALNHDRTRIALVVHKQGINRIDVISLTDGTVKKVWQSEYRVADSNSQGYSPLVSWGEDNMLYVMTLKGHRHTFYRLELDNVNKMTKAPYKKRVARFGMFTSVNDFEVSEDGNSLYIAGDRRGKASISSFNLKTRRIKKLFKPSHSITEIALMPEGKVIMCLAQQKVETYRNIEDFSMLFKYSEEEEKAKPVKVFASSAEGLSISGKGNVVYLRNCKGRKRLFQLDPSTGKETMLSAGILERRLDAGILLDSVRVLVSEGEDNCKVGIQANIPEKEYTVSVLDTLFENEKGVASPIFSAPFMTLSQKDSIDKVFKDIKMVSAAVAETDTLENMYSGILSNFSRKKRKPRKKGNTLSGRMEKTVERWDKVVSSVKEKYYIESFGAGFRADPFRGRNMLFRARLSDVKENHKLDMAVYGFQPKLSNASWKLGYKYLERRLDLGVRYEHTKLEINQMGEKNDIYRFHHFYKKDRLELLFSLPVSEVSRFEVSPLLQWTVHENLGRTMLPEEYRTYYGLGFSFIHDNTRETLQHQLIGIQGRISMEYNREKNHSSGSFAEVYTEWRGFLPLWKDLYLVGRFSGGRFLGGSSKSYMLGGADNWLFYEFSQSPLQIDETVHPPLTDLLFTRTIPVRGFFFNHQSGNNFVGLSSEVRYPIMKFRDGISIGVGRLEQLQLAAFYDIGTAWGGNLSDLTYISKLQVNEGLFALNYNAYKSPFLQGTGVGLRAYLKTWFVRLDMAWDISGHTERGWKPLVMPSLGVDF